jgi:hypothetical protein
MAPLSMNDSENFIIKDDYDIADMEILTNCSTKSCIKKSKEKINNNEPKKTVRFSPYSELYQTISIKDYTQKELENTFSTIYDIERIRFDIHRTLRKMRLGQLPNNEDMYFRGLETEYGQRKFERKESIELAVFAVKQTQCESENGQISDTWVNEVYRHITARSRIAAQKAASWDSVEAKGAH